MPKSAKSTRPRRVVTRTTRAPAVQSTALMVIDHERLQRAAWVEFNLARKRLEKTARDLHRHEEMDVPAYDAWLHRTFPLQVTTLRELHAEVATKAQKIRAVQAQATYAGGSLKRLWRQQKEREANPQKFKAERDAAYGARERSESERHAAQPEDFERASGPVPTRDARDIYRRLVQRLHPDCGGEWTPTRERLWHEVQDAWSAANTDWLARLEIEWETAHDVIGAKSALSRLRRAIEELHAARRDAERKLRDYRVSPAWRFTRNEKNRAVLQRRTESNFAHDIEFLQHQLDYLNRTIAAWEEDWTRETGRKSRQRRTRRY
jgi:hypothetical protein